MSSENQIAQSSNSLVPYFKSDVDSNGTFAAVCNYLAAIFHSYSCFQITAYQQNGQKLNQLKTNL